MLLESKTAVIYGAGGAIGGAVARAFAREGARVFPTGRRLSTVNVVVEQISGAGGKVEADQVDALDEQAVEEHIGSVVKKAGKIDISFNAIGIPAAEVARQGMQGVPFTQLPLEAFSLPITTYPRAHFVTAKAAARHMVAQRSGVILMHTPEPARLGVPLLGRMGPAWAAMSGGRYRATPLEERRAAERPPPSGRSRHPATGVVHFSAVETGTVFGVESGTVFSR